MRISPPHGYRLLLAGGLLASVFFPVGCSRTGSHALGVAPVGSAKTVAEARTAPIGTPMVLRGEMIEKCPTAGCWFILRDGKGTMKIDLAAAGIVAVDVPVHSTVTVGGKTAGSGDSRFLDATGFQY